MPLSVLVLMAVFTQGAGAALCPHPKGAWWNPDLSPKVDHFRFSYDWGDPKAPKITFRNPKGKKEVVILSPKGITLNGKQVCRFKGQTLTQCPKELPVRLMEDTVYAESAGYQGSRILLTYKGKTLEGDLPKGTPCQLLAAETKQKRMVDEALTSRGLAQFLEGAQSCAKGSDRKCLEGLFAKPPGRSLAEGARKELATLLGERAYPRIAPMSVNQPRGQCAEQRLIPLKLMISGESCRSVALQFEKGKWKISDFQFPG